MPNQCGKAFGFNVITPIKRGRVWQLKAGFRLGRMFPAMVGELIRCSFIYFARWVIIKKPPYLGPPQPRERLHYQYLMFNSNFNGGFSQYFDTFSQVVEVQMNDIWQACQGFPNANPVTPFTEYATTNQYDCDYYYHAYPGATSTDVRSALRLREQLDDFELRFANAEPAVFAEEYSKFLRRIQNNLGSTGFAKTAPDEGTKHPTDGPVPA